MVILHPLWNISKKWSEVKVTQSCPTLCNLMDCSLPDSSVHGILQARILEWLAVPFSRGSSQSRDQTQVSCTAGGFFTIWATREAHSNKENVMSRIGLWANKDAEWECGINFGHISRHCKLLLDLKRRLEFCPWGLAGRRDWKAVAI